MCIYWYGSGTKICPMYSETLTGRPMPKFTVSRILKLIAESGTESRSEWMLKRFAFAAQRHVRNSTYQFWTHENHAVEVVSNKFIDQKLDYIHQNPVRAGWGLWWCR